MLKETGLILMIAACTAMGWEMSRQLQGRIRGLAQLQRMMELLKGELQYAGTPLTEALTEAAKRLENPFAGYLSSAAQQIEQRDGRTPGEVFRENAKMLRAESGLLAEDIEFFVQTAGRLGYLDTAMQVRILELYLKELAEKYQYAKEEYQNKGKLYRCMGVMLGLFLVVIFL